MDKIVVEKVLTAVDTTIEAKVNARVGQAELVLAKQISTLKEDVAILREKMQAIAPKNDAHFVNQEDEVNSNDPVSVLLLLLVYLFQFKVSNYSKLTCYLFYILK